MRHDEFVKLLNEARRIPKPTVDLIYVHSRQEIEALYEFFDKRTRNDFTSLSMLAGIPIVVKEDTPPGIMRFTLEGKVVREVAVR